MGEREDDGDSRAPKVALEKKARDERRSLHRNIGILVTDINQSTRKKYGISAQGTGVIVVGVDQSFTDARAGLKVMITKGIGIFGEYRFTSVTAEMEDGIGDTLTTDLKTNHFNGGITLSF